MKMPDFKSACLSPQFKFKLGPNTEPTCISVHSGVLRQLSEKLEAEMTNGMRESKELLVDWSEGDAEVEIDVFLAMYQFGLKGDYHPPADQPQAYFYLNALLQGKEDSEKSSGHAAVLLDSSSDKGANEPPPVAEGDDFPPTEPKNDFSPFETWGASGKNLKKTSKNFRGSLLDPPSVPGLNASKRTLWTTFSDLSAKFDDLGLERPKQHSNPLFHAKVYCLADSQLIEPLKRCCLKYLHRDLLQMESPSSNEHTVLELAALTYEITVRRNSHGDDQLREVVSTYIAAQFQVLQRTRGFRPLLETYGELTADICFILARA